MMMNIEYVLVIVAVYLHCSIAADDVKGPNLKAGLEEKVQADVKTPDLEAVLEDFEDVLEEISHANDVKSPSFKPGHDEEFQAHDVKKPGIEAERAEEIPPPKGELPNLNPGLGEESQYGYGISRPAFKEGLDRAFQHMCSQYQQFGNANCVPGDRKIHLAHVFSWKNIHDWALHFASTKDYAWLKYMIDLLFEIDMEAVVWVGMNHNRQLVYHVHYLGAGLIQKNKDYHTESINLMNQYQRWPNQKTLTDLLEFLNSAPANLRYGYGSINSGIGQKFDPMGNTLRTLTTKEGKWHKSFHAELLLVGSEVWVRHQCDQQPTKYKAASHCPACIGGCFNNHAWRSSSASLDCQNWYICT